MTFQAPAVFHFFGEFQRLTQLVCMLSYIIYTSIPVDTFRYASACSGIVSKLNSFLSSCYRTLWLAANMRTIWASCGPPVSVGEGNGTQEEGRLPKWSIFFSSLVTEWSRKQDISLNANVNTHCKKHHRRSPVLKKKNKHFSNSISPPPPSCYCLFISLSNETPI